MGLVQSEAPSSYDVARDALIHLITGCKFIQTQYNDFLFTHLFEDNINNWLWFHLKLASFEFRSTQMNESSMIDNGTQKLPHFYKPYFLEDLVQDVTHRDFLQRIWNQDLSNADNTVRFAKILFYVGEFQYAINKMLEVSHVVEATLIGVAFSELSMLTTKQSIFETVRSRDPQIINQLQHFSDEQLAVFYDRSFDLDGYLLLLAFRQCN